jgi:hypothetical protein
MAQIDVGAVAQELTWTTAIKVKLSGAKLGWGQLQIQEVGDEDRYHDETVH